MIDLICNVTIQHSKGHKNGNYALLDKIEKEYGHLKVRMYSHMYVSYSSVEIRTYPGDDEEAMEFFLKNFPDAKVSDVSFDYESGEMYIVTLTLTKDNNFFVEIGTHDEEQLLHKFGKTLGELEE